MGKKASPVRKKAKKTFNSVAVAKKSAETKRAGIKDTEANIVKKAKPSFIVGIGASAGGYEAFSQLLEHLSPDTGMAFVFVQHLDPSHESKLTQLLAHSTKMPVVEIEDRMAAEANQIYVIPPARGLTIEEGVFQLRPRRKSNAPLICRWMIFSKALPGTRPTALSVLFFPEMAWMERWA